MRPVDIETDAPVGECASFDALAARVPRGEYTGGIKRLASSETRYTWLEWASQHYRAMHPQPESSENSAPPVEQHELDDGRAASVPTGKACKVKHAKYRAVVGLMSSLELARELGYLQRLLKHAVPSAEQKRGKIAAEEWAKTLCEKLAIVDAQIDLCDLPSQHPPAFDAQAVVVVAEKPVEQPHRPFTQVQQPATPHYDAPGLIGRLHALKAVAA